ncbi:MAG: phytoene desaturase family protein [Planctomycetota bacterium]|jgi:phytoene dehydrogenase-like protein
MSRYDVIVIGGGHNGLVAAALLAGGGRSVALLERSPVLGGLAVGDEFHPGFTAGGVLHDTTTFREHLVERLDLARNGLALCEPPPVFSPQSATGGRGLLLHRDPARAAAELHEHAPADAAHYGAYRAFIERITPFARTLLDAEPPAVLGPSASSLTLAARGLGLRRLGRADMMELLRIAPMCVADWVNEWFETERLGCMVAAPALDGAWMGPWSPGSAANLLRHECLAGRAVSTGPGGLIDSLEQAARQRGVEVRVNADVRRICTSGGAVTGVELADGETIDARAVAASCDPKHALLGLLEGPALEPKLAHQVTTLRSRGTTAAVHLALGGPLTFACRPELEVEHARIAESLDDMERAFDAVKYRRVSTRPILDVHVPSIAAPAMAPSDHHVVSIVAHFAPHDLLGGWTDERREALGSAVVTTLERYAPGLGERIIAHRVMTPVDIEKRYGVSGGHIHHVEHALDQLIARPVPALARFRTPVDGLFLCGSGNHPGGGLTGGPGGLAAAAIMKESVAPSGQVRMAREPERRV